MQTVAEQSARPSATPDGSGGRDRHWSAEQREAATSEAAGGLAVLGCLAPGQQACMMLL